MGLEEQLEEKEVLASIFPDEMTEISPTTYQITINLDSPTPDSSSSIPVQLRITYPPSYPDVAPLLHLTQPSIQTPPNAYLNLPEDTTQLLATLEPLIEENLGMAMVFTLVSGLKENAERLMAERYDREKDERDREAARLEAEENRRFAGERVTVEGWRRWRERWMVEMREKEGEAVVEDGRAKRLTGRELWERGLVGGVEVEEDGDGNGDVVVEGVEGLRVVG